jgi:hypothetical protein
MDKWLSMFNLIKETVGSAAKKACGKVCQGAKTARDNVVPLAQSAKKRIEDAPIKEIADRLSNDLKKQTETLITIFKAQKAEIGILDLIILAIYALRKGAGAGGNPALIFRELTKILSPMAIEMLGKLSVELLKDSRVGPWVKKVLDNKRLIEFVEGRAIKIIARLAGVRK